MHNMLAYYACILPACLRTRTVCPPAYMGGRGEGRGVGRRPGLCICTFKGMHRHACMISSRVTSLSATVTLSFKWGCSLLGAWLQRQLRAIERRRCLPSAYMAHSRCCCPTCPRCHLQAEPCQQDWESHKIQEMHPGIANRISSC